VSRPQREAELPLSRGFTDAYPEVFAHIERRSFVARDGTRIAYQVIGEHDDVIVVANGLGTRIYGWLPIIEALRDRYRVVLWDYRGLYGSGLPQNDRRLSVRDHAEDVAGLLDALDARRADLIGWSMGVQVALEFGTLYPERTRSLILVNGTYGGMFETALQPLFRVPGAAGGLHALAEYLARNPRRIDRAGRALRAVTDAAFQVRRALRRRTPSTMVLAGRQYVHDIFDDGLERFLALSQQIDAHSAYHLLPHVSSPTLIISGGLDFITPAYQSRQMARRIPGAKHVSFPFGAHFIVLERPAAVIAAVEEHLAQRS